MGIETFFDFASRSLSSALQAHAIGLKTGVNGKDEHWNLIKGIYQGIDFPVIFRQDEGKKLTDILDTGWPNFYLIADRLKNILKDNNLTGWQTFAIKLYDKKEEEIIDYHGFSVLGSSGPPNYKSSEIIEIRKVTNGPLCRYYKGVSVDNWDGSDFFIPEGTYQTIITKRAADILKKNKITNMCIENLSDYQVPASSVERKN